MPRILTALTLAAAVSLPVAPSLSQATPPAPTDTTEAAPDATPSPDAAATDAAAPDTADDATPAAPVIDPQAPAGDYVFDQEHSHIVFSFDHLGKSTAQGLIRGVAGTVTLDPADPASSKVEVMFPLSAIQTVSGQLDEKLGEAQFFDGDAPATAITYTSTKVEPTGANTARVTGDLLLNDITKPVTLDVTLRFLGNDPMTKQPSAGFDITGTLKRSDFGLGAFAPAVSDDIQLRIGVEAAKGG